MEKIYENIKAIRKSKNISQADMADKLGMYPANYGKLENGLTQLTIERLTQIAEIFGMTVFEIMQYGGETVQQPQVIDNEKVKELENKVEELEKQIALMAETIYLLKELKEKEKKIEKLRMAEIISMLTVISKFHPETVSTIENLGTDTEIGILVNNIKMALYKDDKFQKSVEKL